MTQLMLKPTVKCNFTCSFCSAAKLCQKDQTVVDDKLREAIKKIDPDNIIITGGDPLMLPVKYFYDLLAINDKITLSLTSNLWDFYLHPDKWTELFKNERVGICTSFQYGDGRRLPDGKPYTEELFRKVMALFKEKVGKVPPFIAVISKENEDRAIDHVLLAKELGTTCKLNGLLPLGRSEEYYPRYKMMDIYLKILDMGLEEYEDNTFDRAKGNCPFNIDHQCFKHNRAIRIDKDGNYQYGYCEDLVYNGVITFDSVEDISEKDDILNDLINPEKCPYCPLFRFCNNCKLHRDIAKTDKDYCNQMNKYSYILEDRGFKI